MFQPRLLLEQLDAVPGHEPQRDDPQRHPEVDQPNLITGKSDGRHHIVKAQTQVHQRDHRHRRPKTVMTHIHDLAFFGSRLLLLREMGTHQPDQIGASDQHQPGIRHDEARHEQRHDSEPVGTCVADVHRHLLLLGLKMGRHRGNRERVVHGEQAFDDNQPDHHRHRIFDHRPGICGCENLKHHEGCIVKGLRWLSSTNPLVCFPPKISRRKITSQLLTQTQKRTLSQGARPSLQRRRHPASDQFCLRNRHVHQLPTF